MSTLKEIQEKKLYQILAHNGVGIQALKSLTIGMNGVSELVPVPMGVYVKIGAEDFLIPYPNVVWCKYQQELK